MIYKAAKRFEAKCEFWYLDLSIKYVYHQKT